MIPRAALFGCLCAAQLSTAAHAQPQPQQPAHIDTAPILLGSFDLRNGPGNAERLAPLPERAEWQQSNNIPQTRWAYHPAPRGPEIEFAAFGAGHKDMPSLAHVGLDWIF